MALCNSTGWTKQLKSILAGEDLSVLVDVKLNTSKQFSLGVKGIKSTLACDRKIVAIRSREVTFYTALVRHLESGSSARKTWMYWRKLKKGQKDD